MSELCYSFAKQIEARLQGFKPEIVLILGSGLGDLATRIQNAQTIDYADIAGFPQSTVSGHQGRFVFGRFKKHNVLCMQGRVHLYEGHTPSMISQIIKTFKLLGAEKLIVTNAAGSLNPKIPAGSVMMITDHINLSFANPLIGPNDENLGPRFPDLSNAYDKNLQQIARQAAAETEIVLREGVYLMVSGPNFETAAEVRAFGILGGDAVGMSTVPEVISAAHVGLKTLGFSVITNLGTGLQTQSQSHAETLAVAQKASADLAKLLDTVLERI
jgi:inosine/guanosine/xanthosine phosphorylase family protein